MEILAGNYILRELGAINIIMGKNGCGKSRLLRVFDDQLNRNQEFLVKYVSPERGGALAVDAGVVNTIQGNPEWAPGQRRKNRVENFRQISVAEFQFAELRTLREIEKDLEKRNDPDYTFDTTVNEINNLLDNVKVVRTAKSPFTLQSKNGDEAREPAMLSSGESELLSVAIEILSFASEIAIPENQDRKGLLLLDEPDVHLHPDLQSRLMQLLASATSEKNITTLIATHSTAILGGLGEAADTKVSFMKKDDTDLTFSPISNALKEVIPVFGAHPLSNIFNQSPILLVEGPDDTRIWQQAVRSSRGRLKLWPCPAGNVQSLCEYERTASQIIGAVYEDAKAFSLRDRDGMAYEIDDIINVTRMRLHCRTAENLILTDDVLAILGVSWDQMQQEVTNWIANHPNHQRLAEMQSLSANWDRLNARVKNIRNIIIGLTPYGGAWETAVGQAIANLTENSPDDDASLIYFLGSKAVESLGLVGQ